MRTSGFTQNKEPIVNNLHPLFAAILAMHGMPQSPPDAIVSPDIQSQDSDVLAPVTTDEATQ